MNSSNLFYDFTLERKVVLFFLLLSCVFHFMVAGLIYTFSIEKPPDKPPLFARVVTAEELQTPSQLLPHQQRSAVTSPPVPLPPSHRPYKETAKENKDIINSPSIKRDYIDHEMVDKDGKSSGPAFKRPEELIKLPEQLISPPEAITLGPSSSKEALAKLFDRDIIKEQTKKEAVKERPPELTFDTKEFRYQGYMNRLKEKIESLWRYPLSAAQRGIYGDLYIRFSIKKDGSLGRVDLVRTSGYRELDDAAMKALYDAAPYWPLPSEWGLDEFIIEGHFIYTLYGYYIR